MNSKPHCHIAVYSGRVVFVEDEPRKAFRRAAMRVADNAGEGYVITPRGDVHQITRSSKLARLVTDRETREAVIRQWREAEQPAFALQREAAERPKPPEPIRNNERRLQRVLLTGLDCLAGQQDLFQGIDGA